MSDDMASDWSAVIIAECKRMTDAEFQAGCEYARRNSADHRGVLKAIFDGSKAAKPGFASRYAKEWNDALAGRDQRQISGARPIGNLIEGRRV